MVDSVSDNPRCTIIYMEDDQQVWGGSPILIPIIYVSYSCNFIHFSTSMWGWCWWRFVASARGAYIAVRVRSMAFQPSPSQLRTSFLTTTTTTTISSTTTNPRCNRSNYRCIHASNAPSSANLTPYITHICTIRPLTDLTDLPQSQKLVDEDSQARWKI